MTYLQLIKYIKKLALEQINVNTFAREFIDLNREHTEYSAIVLQDREHSGLGDEYLTYNFWLGYFDRLNDDKGNADEIVSTAIQVLKNVVNTLIHDGNLANVSVGSIVPILDQKFLAACSGAYLSLSITVPVGDCAYKVSGDFNDDFNDDFLIN